ncbi:MAG: hypothetical protein ACTSRI_19915 [Promethearchaeota archaeon]
MEPRFKFFGILNIVFTLPQVIGAFIAAIIIGLVGLQYIFIFSIVFFLSSIILFLWVEETLKMEK